jgi:hypothetical protein
LSKKRFHPGIDFRNEETKENKMESIVAEKITDFDLGTEVENSVTKAQK